MGVIIWAKQVCATQKAFCLTYSRIEQKIYIFLGEGYISLHSDSQSSVGEVISSLSQSQEQGSYSYKEYIIPKERKGKKYDKKNLRKQNKKEKKSTTKKEISSHRDLNLQHNHRLVAYNSYTTWATLPLNNWTGEIIKLKPLFVCRWHCLKLVKLFLSRIWRCIWGK